MVCKYQNSYQKPQRSKRVAVFFYLLDLSRGVRFVAACQSFFVLALVALVR